ncbi:hypothetical protein ACH5RR_034317 [Cinchona calisaya]|uniref:Uncharacterized protein n=1 Tax=Cinchona calisaya TaxID=153742 RepID=A0ABD2YCQ5_9GENT
MNGNWCSSNSSEPSFSNDHNMVMWSNLAFNHDNDEECSSQDKYSISSSTNKDTIYDKPSFLTSHVTKEEFQIREELGKEIEKELEREIMEGILVLVKRLSNLKAKQILRSLTKLNLDEFLNVLHGSSNFGSPKCKDAAEEYEYDSPWYNGQIAPKETVSVRQFSVDNEEEQVLEDADKESTMERWSYLSE